MLKVKVLEYCSTLTGNCLFQLKLLPEKITDLVSLIKIPEHFEYLLGICCGNEFTKDCF